ncbi:MAG: hypothetical protein PHV30_09195 [Candidatus Margulisbacteria bacterium]|nr:hypothetical protein [Candidatus Margulisiibacteriota bacterium]
MKKNIVINSLIILAGLIIYIYINICTYHPTIFPWGQGADSDEYWSLSENLLKHHKLLYPSEWNVSSYLNAKGKALLSGGLDSSGFVFNLKRTPLYPLLLGFMRHFWNHAGAAFLLNYFSYVGICIYSLLLGKLIFKEKKLLFYIYFTAVVFSPIYFDWNGVLSDVLASFFLVGFTYHLLSYYQNVKSDTKKFASFFLSPFLLIIFFAVCSFMTRPNLLIFVVLLLLFILIKLYFKKYEWRVVFLILIFFMISVFLWSYRNFGLSGKFSPTVFVGYNMLASYIDSENSPNRLVRLVNNDIKPGTKFYEWKDRETIKKYIAGRLNSGRTYYQAIGDMDKKTGEVTIQFLINNPLTGLKKIIINNIYYYAWTCYDIPYLLINIASPKQLLLFASQGKQAIITKLSVPGKIWLMSLNFVSYSYKFLILLTTFFYFVFFFMQKRSKIFRFSNDISVYTALFIAGFITAFVDGVCGGMRLRMPFNPLNILFFILFFYNIYILLQRNKNKSVA